MPYGLIASLILHAVLLGWALLKIEQTPQLVVTPPEAVEIAMVADDGIVRLKQGERDSKNLEAEGKQGEAKEPPKKEAAKPTPPPPEGAMAAPSHLTACWM